MNFVAIALSLMLLPLQVYTSGSQALQACTAGSQSEEFRPLRLLHFSDLHGSKLHLQRIVEYMDSHELDDAIHTGYGVICYFDDENVFETVPGGRRVLNTIGNHDCWKGHLVWAQTNKPYDAEKGDTYVRFFIGPDAQSPTVKGWEVTQPAGVDGYMLDKDRSGENTDAFNIVSWDPSRLELRVERVGCADGYHGSRGFTVSAASL